jgi:hypothetical protein
MATPGLRSFSCNLLTGPSPSLCILNSEPACMQCPSGTIPSPTNTPPGQCDFATCSRPDDTSSTVYTFHCSIPILHNTLCTPLCQSGHTANASLSRLCSNGDLRPSVGSCNPNPCPVPTSTASTSFSTCQASTPSGSSCTPVCRNGYTASASLQQDCSLGTFSAPAGTCLPNPCLAPANNTNITYGNCEPNVASGSSCTPTCNPGYTATASLAITCSLGNFSTPLGFCLATPCPRPSDTASLNHTSCPSTIPSGSSCTPVCSSGYTASASLRRDCSFGTLSAPLGVCNPSPCLPPASVPNITYASCTPNVASGSTCAPTCNPGYTATASLNVTCSLGVYSAPAGFCAADPCPRPSDTASTSYASCLASTPSSSTCTPTCTTGYTPAPTNDVSLTCLAGSFQSPASTCQPTPCTSMPLVDFPTTAGTCISPIASGSTCSLGCAPGYAASTPTEFSCSFGDLSLVGFGTCELMTASNSRSPIQILSNLASLPSPPATNQFCTDDNKFCITSGLLASSNAVEITITNADGGWVAFGLGFGMSNADMVTCSSVDEGGTWLIEDRSSSSQSLPAEDPVQDIITTSAGRVSGITTCTFRRFLAIQPGQSATDRAITCGSPILILYARGATSSDMDLAQHLSGDSHRGQGTLDFCATPTRSRSRSPSPTRSPMPVETPSPSETQSPSASSVLGTLLDLPSPSPSSVSTWCTPDDLFCISSGSLSGANAVEITIETRTGGWVGMGFGSSKSNADVAVCSAQAPLDFNFGITDRKSVAEEEPSIDASQDIILVSAGRSAGTTTCTFRRYIAATDSDDSSIACDQSVSFIYAFGESSMDGSVSYHDSRRGSASMVFCGSIKPNNPGGSGGSSSGAAIGAGVGAGLGLTALGAGGYYYWKNKKIAGKADTHLQSL